MGDKIFVYKLNEDDRDAVAYFNSSDLDQVIQKGRGYLGVCGPAYSMGFTQDDYEDVKTFLSRELFEALQGNPTKENLIAVREALTSDGAADFFAEIVQEEIERITEEYGLDEEEVEQIFDESPCGYTDFGLISCVYDDAEELAREYAEDIFDIPDSVSCYFDYERMGKHMVNEGEQYVELPDERIVCLNL